MHEIFIEELKVNNTMWLKKFGVEMVVSEITKLPSKSYEVTFESGDAIIIKPRTKIEVNVE